LTTIKDVFALAMVEMETRGAPLLRNPASPDLMQVVGYRRRSRAADNHHPALAYQEMPAFMADLAKVGTTAARLLEFIILTTSRSGAARLARFDQIDIGKGLWRIPAEQLKDSEHRADDLIVPLSPAALAVVETMRAASTSPYVFAGDDAEPLNGDLIITLIRALRRRGGWRDPKSLKPITIHGFRATFRTWVEETRRRDRDFAELCLGHKTDGDVESRYIRTELLAKRAALLNDWSRHCAGQSAEVRQFRRVR
jgi:integrase